MPQYAELLHVPSIGFFCLHGYWFAICLWCETIAGEWKITRWYKFLYQLMDKSLWLTNFGHVLGCQCRGRLISIADLYFFTTDKRWVFTPSSTLKDLCKETLVQLGCGQDSAGFDKKKNQSMSFLKKKSIHSNNSVKIRHNLIVA